MKNLQYNRVKVVLLFLMLNFSLVAYSDDATLQKDVQSLDSIVNAYYSVVSGPEGFEFDPTTDTFLHAPNAIITRFNETGEFQRHGLTEEHKTLQKPYAEGFYEVEINRVVEEYGHLAHVWSTNEFRESPTSKAFMRGINSISLYYKDNRWWIASWNTQYEGEEKIPLKYLPEKAN